MRGERLSVYLFVAVILVAGGAFAWAATRADGGRDVRSSTTTVEAAAGATTTAPPPVQTRPGATPSTVPDPGPDGGTLERASTALRQACRRFYDHDLAEVDRALTEAELVAACDEPEIEWRGDCYTQRPAVFVPGVGGCAHLRGYLAVWYGRQPFAADHPPWYFDVDGDPWTIVPESD
jgi:hypothetical protein